MTTKTNKEGGRIEARQYIVELAPSYPCGDKHPMFCVGYVVDRPESYYNAVVPVCYFPSRVENGFYHNDPAHVANANAIAAALNAAQLVNIS